MTHIILVLTGYLNIIVVALYAYVTFRLFGVKRKKRRKKLLRRQQRYLLLFHFFSNITLILQKNEMKLLYFYALQVLFLITVMILFPLFYRNASRVLTNNFLFFSIVGLVMLTRLSYEDYALKQFFTIVVCFAIAFVIPLLMGLLKFWEKCTWIYGVGGFFMLATVLVLGVNMYGATNWISIAGITLQPSEFAKIFFVLFVACRLSKSLELKDLIITTIFAAAYVLFLVCEKDLGAALIFFMVYVIMLYVATGRLALLVTSLLAGGLASILAYQLFSHVRVRVNIWMDPWATINDAGGQICQSLFAIGTGSWFGIGLGQGKPYMVPIVYSDFIFSALAEEFGTIFVICLLLIFVSCLIVFLDASMHAHKKLHKLLVLGIGVCFTFQVFLNVGGVVKFIPLTGVTLPLISYGRSSVASVLILFGLAQGICVISGREEDDDETEQEAIQ